MSDNGAFAVRLARELGEPRKVKKDVPETAHPTEARKVTKLHVGPIHSSVAGRTDHLPVHVPSGSYVLPAHHVSALGEGNTMAGFSAVKRIFSGLPYAGAGMPYGANGGPYGSKLPKADGGAAVTKGEPVAVVLAGGEYVLTPQEVAAAGDGDLDQGCKVLDAWVKQQTQNTAKVIKHLPPPRQD